VSSKGNNKECHPYCHAQPPTNRRYPLIRVSVNRRVDHIQTSGINLVLLLSFQPFEQSRTIAILSMRTDAWVRRTEEATLLQLRSTIRRCRAGSTLLLRWRRRRCSCCLSRVLCRRNVQGMLLFLLWFCCC
jgi:hypothetical protein